MTAAAGSEMSTEHGEIMIDFACIMKLILHHIRGKKKKKKAVSQRAGNPSVGPEPPAELS